MLNKMSITWNCKQVANMIKKGKCSFDNIVQRSYVWEKQRMSDLIHSIVENYPVPPFYTRRIDGVYDFLDGKQRMKAISSYLDDGFCLANIPPVTYESFETGELERLKQEKKQLCFAVNLNQKHILFLLCHLLGKQMNAELIVI